MSELNEIRAASARFYAALNSMAAGDPAPMADVWVNNSGVSAQHPIGGRDEGYDSVIASFAKVSEIAEGGEIRLLQQRISVGADMAVETGVEAGSLTISGQAAAISHRVTNVYVRSDGIWKMAHHHTDVSDGLLDLLKRLNGSA